MGLNVRNFGGALIDAITTTRAPLATDNIYKIGQIWVDEAADKFYILTDITAGVATWSGGGGGGGGTYAYTADPLPGVITTAILDAYDGIKIELASAINTQVLGTPTDADKLFAVINLKASSFNLTITASGVSKVFAPGEGQLYFYDGANWNEVEGDIDAYVPYIGASTDLDLGAHNAKANAVELAASPTVGAFKEGKMFYDETWKTVSAHIDSDVTLQIGQEDHRMVYNNSGKTIHNGYAVYITGVYNSGTNDVPTVAKAQANAVLTADVKGIATQEILNGHYGIITSRGFVNDLRTSQAGAAWVTTQNLTFACMTGGTDGNSCTVEVVDTGSGGLTFTEAGTATVFAVVIDLGGTTPTTTQVRSACSTATKFETGLAGTGLETVVVAAAVPFANGSTVTAGDVLYLSEVVAGMYSNVVPPTPNFRVKVGRMITISATVGRIYVDIQQVLKLGDLADVTAPAPVVDNVLKWNGTAWVNGAGVTVSGSTGIDFYNATPVINSRISPAGLNQAGTAGNGIKVDSLSKTPVTVVTGAVTITKASPAVVTFTGHGLPLLAPIVFTNIAGVGGTFTGITAGTIYYVGIANYGANSFQISSTSNGTTYVNTAGTGTSGTATCTATDLTVQAITGTIQSEVRAYSAWLYNTALGRTLLDSGTWEFSTYAGVDSVASGRNTVITSNVYQVVPASSGTVTVTGSAANVRIATITSGQFTGGYYLASPTNINGSWLQTTTGIYQILQGYTFTVTAATAAAGDTYTNNGQTFTVVAAIAGGTTLICTGTGAPAASGNLVRTSGAGTNPIVFSTFALANTTNVVYLAVPTGYSNDSAVAFNIWNKLFGAATPAITAITPAYGLVTGQSAQPAFTVALTDKLGRISFLSNTGSNAAVTMTTGFNGTLYNTKLRSPLITLHNNLSGLNVADYQHLSAAQLTFLVAILSVPVVTAVAYDITTNYATTNTIEYRGLGAAITNQALPASNVAAGQAFVARSLTLINADPTYSVTLIPDAGQSDTADETILLPGESFVFRLVLLDKKWKLV